LQRESTQRKGTIYGAVVIAMRLVETQVGQQLGAGQMRDWVNQVIALLDVAIAQLEHEETVHRTLLAASTLLRSQVEQRRDEEAQGDRTEGLLGWQMRSVLEHIDRRITSRVLVADLCALVQRSQAHFSRSFRRTFGHSPHAFVVRRRVELASQQMLLTDASLSDIALRCGFVDQAHLSKHFRKLMGETPAAWRRARRAMTKA
jgi:AraC family transcriptional regulator